MNLRPTATTDWRGPAAPKSPLVIFAPYPPSTNGIAAYVSELMPYHLAEFDVTLVVADDASARADGRHAPRVLLASEFRKHRAFFEGAPKLYHIGNNPDHCYMLEFLARDRGIVVLHDYNLNYLHEVATLGWKGPSGCFSPLEMEYGALGADGVRSRFERGDRGLFATYELPLNGDVLEAATGVVTHSRYAQYKSAARVPQTPVWYIPHHLSPTLARYAQTTQPEARRDLGLPASEIIVTALGFITYAKKIPMLLAALAELRARLPPFRLVLAGERCPEQYDVDNDIAAAGLKGVTHCTGYLEEVQFFQHLAACDIVANLRHPSGGEMSGTLIRALGMGAPTIVFDDGPMGELPDNVVRKVPWDAGTQIALISALYDLISDKSRRLELGARATIYAHENHAIETSAQRYAEIVRFEGSRAGPPRPLVLREHIPHPKMIAPRLRQIHEENTSHGVQPPDGRLWWQCARAPLGKAGERALVLSPNPRPTGKFLARVFEWHESDVTALTLDAFLAPTLRDENGKPLPQGAFTFALAIVPAHFAENRAAALMRRINAALRRWAVFTLEAWSELEEEYDDVAFAENSIAGRLTDAGFAGVSKTTPREAFFNNPSPAHQERGQRFACFSGRKASSFALWRISEELEGTPLHFGGRIG